MGFIKQDSALAALERAGGIVRVNRPDEAVALPPYTPTPTVLGTQVGGDHYTKHAIQPIEYIWANNLGFSEGNVIKYVTRWKDKGGIKDLEKARHHLSLLIEHAQKADVQFTGVK